MGRRRHSLPLRCRYSAEEYARLGIGLVAQTMDDKWFSRLDENILSFYRSWTGVEIFRVHLRPTQDGAEITQAWLNTQQWKGYHPFFEARFLRYLIDVEILQKAGEFPNANPLDALLRLWWGGYVFLTNLTR